MLNLGIFAPHSPGLLPGFADAEIAKFEQTIRALLSIGIELKKNPPETLIVLSPHADAELDKFLVRVPKSANFTADFSEFNIKSEPKIYRRDRILTAQITEVLHSAGLPNAPLENEKLDFGTAIPLHFLAAALPEIEIVNIATSLIGIPEHQKLGEVISEVAEKSSKRVALIASGELSHKVSKASPLGFAPRAEEWEQGVLAAIADGTYEKIFHADPFELDEVAECGVRPLAGLLGAFQNIPHTSHVLAHEAPAGIGLATILLTKKM